MSSDSSSASSPPTSSATRWRNSSRVAAIGALTRAPQLDLLESQVADAVAKGARLLIGGERSRKVGNWFEPTVLVDVNHSMELMREEFQPKIWKACWEHVVCGRSAAVKPSSIKQWWKKCTTRCCI